MKISNHVKLLEQKNPELYVRIYGKKFAIHRTKTKARIFSGSAQNCLAFCAGWHEGFFSI